MDVPETLRTQELHGGGFNAFTATWACEHPTIVCQSYLFSCLFVMSIMCFLLAFATRPFQAAFQLYFRLLRQDSSFFISRLLHGSVLLQVFTTSSSFLEKGSFFNDLLRNRVNFAVRLDRGLVT